MKFPGDAPAALQTGRRGASPAGDDQPCSSGLSSPGGMEMVFRHFDEDGDGKISPSELCACMRSVGQELSLEEAAAVVESADSDGDGLLGLEDFARLAEAGEDEERERDLREAFGVYEMEGLGCITAGSLWSALGRLGNARDMDECKAMICRFDLNGDGVISFDEFQVMMAC